MAGIPSTKKNPIEFFLHTCFLLSLIILLIHYCILSIRGWGGRVENISIAEAVAGQIFGVSEILLSPYCI